MGQFLPTLYHTYQYFTGSSPSGFPAFDLAHANCAMSTSVPVSCQSAFAALHQTVTTFKDPANGLYAMVQEASDTSIWVTRTTPTKHYVDDIEFEFETSSTGTCNINAKSRSQSLSYYDFDTNYCNMYNVLRSSGLSFAPVVPS